MTIIAITFIVTFIKKKMNEKAQAKQLGLFLLSFLKEVYMTCPVCGGETMVMDSRSTEDETKRKRRCKDDSCRYIFRTIELDEDQYKNIIAQLESLKGIDKAKITDILQRCDLALHGLSEVRSRVEKLT